MNEWNDRNIEKICSYCGYEKEDVIRHINHGTCDGCSHVVTRDCLTEGEGKLLDSVKRANSRLKNGYMPWLCACESTRAMGMCDDETCDGTFFWYKP